MKHILIAEDQQSARFVLTFQLKKAGFKVTAVENGALALKTIQENIDTENQIELLVTDIEMPEMSGLDLYKNLSEQNIEIPIIVMTAYGSKNVVVELMKLGCSEYLDKPFPPEELIKRVNQIFEEIAEQNEKHQKIENDKTKLQKELNSYKLTSDKLREQVNSAKTAYEDLIKVDDDDLDINLSYKIEPLADLGGDFFSIKETSTGYDILLADVAGHDIGSSYHTILIKNVFEENLRLKNNGSEFFRELNSRLIKESKKERLVTAVFIRIDLEMMRADITSAGHPLPIYIGANSYESKQVVVFGDILGILEEVFFETNFIDLSSKDRLLFFTDGVEDSEYIDKETNEKIKITSKGLLELSNNNKGLELNKFVENIWLSVQDFGKNNAKDDMTLVGIEIK